VAPRDGITLIEKPVCGRSLTRRYLAIREAINTIARYELLLLALATPFLLFPGIWTPIGVTFIALAWACRWIASGRLSVRTAMDIPIILLLIMTGVSLIPSVDLDLSLNRFWIYILGVALFYGMVNGLHSERHVHLMGIGLVLVGLVVALVSFVGTDWKIGILVEIPAIYDRLPGPLIRGLPGSGVLEEYDLVNPRLVAGTLAILLPVPLAYLILGQGWKPRLLSGLTALMMMAVLLLTQAPQGFLGLAVALALIVVWWSRWALLGVALGLGGLIVAWRFFDAQQRVSSWLAPQAIEVLDFGVYSRVVDGAWGVAMIRDMPYTGIGLNTFPVVNELYSSGRDHVVHAHNTLIQTAVDLGIPGTIVLIALLAAFGFTAARAYRASLNPNQRALLIGICGAIAAWLAYGLLDAITLGHKSAAVLWVMLGLVVAMRLRVRQSATRAATAPSSFSRKSFALALLLLLLLVAIAGLTARKAIGTFYLNLGVMESHRALANADSPYNVTQHLDAAEGYFHQAIQWNPSATRAHHLLDWIHSLDGDILSKRWPRDSANVERWRNVFGRQQ
jgi:putative inorganic carbon (HCO3(-)) transporter